MMQLIYIGCGGFIGAIMRYAVTHWTRDLTSQSGFPYGTLIANLLGCLLIGALSVFAETHDWMTPAARAFLMIGFLGAFTTFSTFGLESHNLFQAGNAIKAAANVGLHVFLGILCVVLGRAGANHFVHLF